MTMNVPMIARARSDRRRNPQEEADDRGLLAAGGRWFVTLAIAPSWRGFDVLPLSPSSGGWPTTLPLPMLFPPPP